MKYLFLLMMITILPSCTPTNTSNFLDYSLSDHEISNMQLSPYEKKIFTLVNKHRLKKGLKALAYNPVIQYQAFTHSNNMAQNKIGFGHGQFNTRAKNIAKKLERIKSVAENVAYGQTSAKQVVKGWLQSPTHRINIEGNFNLSGLSAKKDRSGRWYYTQIFVKK